MHGLTVLWSLDGAPEGVGSAPVLVEPCEVAAVAEGAAGFLAAPSYA